MILIANNLFYVFNWIYVCNLLNFFMKGVVMIQSVGLRIFWTCLAAMLACTFVMVAWIAYGGWITHMVCDGFMDCHILGEGWRVTWCVMAPLSCVMWPSPSPPSCLINRSETHLSRLSTINVNELVDDHYAALHCVPRRNDKLRKNLELELPVTVHVRDKMFQSEAEKQCLAVLQEMLLPEHPVYWHCFLGSAGQYKAWKAAFPSLKIGVGPKALNTARLDDRLRELLKVLPLEDILLETDAPLQLPFGRYKSRESSHHRLRGNLFMVLDVAHDLTKLRSISTSAICYYTVNSSRQFFKC